MHPKLCRIFSSRIPQCLKTKVFDQFLLPVLTYGSQTWSLTMGLLRKLEVTQRVMERGMSGVSLRDRIRNEGIESERYRKYTFSNKSTRNQRETTNFIVSFFVRFGLLEINYEFRKSVRHKIPTIVVEYQ